jgi:DNA modification methylase
VIDLIQLHHGDCLEIMKSIPDGSVDMILTDPPYGTTACKWDTVIPFEPMWEQVWRVLKPNGACLLFGLNPFSSMLGASQIKFLQYSWAWDKKHATGHLNAKKRPMKQVEDILVFYKKQPTYNAQDLVYEPKKMKNSDSDCQRGLNNKTSTVRGGLKKEYEQIYKNWPRNLISFKSENGNKQHPTRKPVPLLEYLIKTYTLEGETVLDFTMGSGSSGVACVNLNRKFIGIEKDLDYFEIAKKRIGDSLCNIN